MRLVSDRPGSAPIPELSVILPLVDDHGMAEVCLDSWIDQRCVGDRLQLVVVDHGVGARRAARLKGRLRSGDLWIESADSVESVLYDLGAHAAEAPLLLFSEAHCVARPDAADEVLRCFRDGGLSAAVLGSGHLESEHQLSRMQAALETEWVGAWPAGHFRTISLRGFAIRREVYLSLGGFRPAHGRFCETAMGIALASSGHRIGRTATVLDHLNCTRVSDLGAALSACARGQLAWREEMEAQMPKAANEWLGEVGIWKRRATLAPSTARSMLRLIASSWVSDLGRAGFFAKARGTLRKVPWLLAGAFPGGFVLRCLAQLRFAGAAARWWIAHARGAPLAPRFRDLWNSAFARGFFDHVSRNPLAPVWEPVTEGSRSIGELSEGALAGFHAAELRRETQSGRASGTVALLRLRFPPGDVTLRLAWDGPHSVADGCLTVFFNGRRVPAQALNVDPQRLEVRVPREACRSDERQELSFTCRGLLWDADGDRRLLGVTLFGIVLRPTRGRREIADLHRKAGSDAIESLENAAACEIPY